MFNKKRLKLFFLLPIIIVLLSSCKADNNIDDIYQRKINSLDRKSDIEDILYNLNFPDKYSYKSMDLDLSENINELILYFTLKGGESINIDDFKYDSALIFSLIENLDEISFYIEDRDTTTVEIVTRERIDSMTRREFNQTTRDLGKNKESFSNLLELYKKVN